jgi:hypothetical protein
VKGSFQVGIHDCLNQPISSVRIASLFFNAPSNSARISSSAIKKTSATASWNQPGDAQKNSSLHRLSGTLLMVQDACQKTFFHWRFIMF